MCFSGTPIPAPSPCTAFVRSESQEPWVNRGQKVPTRPPPSPDTINRYRREAERRLAANNSDPVANAFMGYSYLQRMPGIKDEKEGNELLRTVREHFMLAAINDISNPEQWLLLAKCKLLLADQTGCLECLEKAKPTMQKSVAFWITSANYHFRCDDQHNAFKSLVRALNSCSERWAITYYNLAVLYDNNSYGNHIHDTIECFELYLENPDDMACAAAARKRLDVLKRHLKASPIRSKAPDEHRIWTMIDRLHAPPMPMPMPAQVKVEVPTPVTRKTSAGEVESLVETMAAACIQ